MTYDFSKGVLTQSQDPNGIATQWSYDEFFRKTKELRPDGTATTWAYNNCSVAGCLNSNNVLTIVQQRINTDNSVLRTDNTYYDTMNRVLATSGQMLNGAYDRIETQYDTLGRIGRQSVPCSFSGCNSYWTVPTYDALNRVTQSQRPISASNSTPQYTNYIYQGRSVTVQDAQGKNTIRTYLVTGAERSVQDANGYSLTTSRDAFDSPTRVTDNQSTPVVWSTKTWVYGMVPIMTASSDLSVGNYTYTVDALGETTAYKDLKNQNFSMTYDALSRPLVRTEPDLTTTWTWGTVAANHEIGQLKNVISTSPTGSNQYTDARVYDSDGRLQERQLTLPIDGQHNFDYTYAPTTGLLSALAYPMSATPATYRVTAGYTYQNGLLQEIYDANATSTIWWKATATNYRGQITTETTSSGSSAPQITSNRNFDAVTGWVSTIQSGVNGGTGLQNEAYTYDEMGNVTQRQNIRVGLTENFYYDNLYRLNCSTLGAPAGSTSCTAPYTNLQMCYDNTGGACTANLPGPGNITSRSDVAGGAAWTYDATHKQYVTQAGSSSYTYQYDFNGNVNSRNGSNIGSTSYNYPSYVQTGTESASFDYGPDRQRWRMVYQNSSGTETTYYATSLYEKVATSSGTDYRHYIYAGNRPVMIISRTAAGAINVRSLLSDHQGSISTIVTDSTGVADVNESFTAYGVRRDANSWSGAPTSGDLSTMNGVTRQGYTFQTVLGTMGLNHMNARVQDAVTGVFLAADPTIPAPGITMNYHHMAYANNNPLTYVDPSGFATETTSPTPQEVDPAQDPQLAEIVVQTQRSTAPTVQVSITLQDAMTPDVPNQIGEITVHGTRTSDTTKPKPKPIPKTPGLPPVVQVNQPNNLNPQKSRCPSGKSADVAYGLYEMGKNSVQDGKLAVAAGTGLAITGVEVPAAALVSAGGRLTLTGFVMQLGAGSYLAMQGDSGPIDATFASLLNQNIPNVPNITPSNPFSTDFSNRARSTSTCPVQ